MVATEEANRGGADANPRLRVGLTGASGTIGQRLHHRLRCDGHQVDPIGRSNRQDGNAVDLTDGDALIEALSGLDLLVHAAGKVSADLAQNLSMAGAIGRAAHQLGLPVLHLSSVSVYGPTPQRRVDERTPCAPTSAYGQSKLAAERAFDEANTTVCHLRIGSVVTSDELHRAASPSMRSVLKAGEITSFVLDADVEDAVSALAQRFATDGTMPTHINLVRPEIGHVTFRELGGSPHLLPAPPPVVPHLLRRMRGRDSIPARQIFESQALDEIGFEFGDLASDSTRARVADAHDALRVLHVTDSINLRFGGGTATRTLDVAREMAKRGARVSVLSVRAAGDATDPPADGHLVRYETVRSPLRRFLLPVIGVRAALELVADHDVVHCIGHWSLINAVIGARCRRLGVPYVVCPAGALPIWGRSGILKRVYNRLTGDALLAGAAAWIAVTDDEVPQFGPHGIAPDAVTVIPNGMDEPSDDLALVDPGAVPTGPYVLFLGRLNAIKGPDLLLEAFLDRATDLPFDLVFAGPDVGLLDELRSKATASDHAGRVIFAGFIAGQQKQDLLRACRALVIPSRHEAMSIVVLEAARYAKPVLATTECGLSELIDFPGWLVPPTVEDIGEGLAMIAEEIDPSVGTQLRDRAQRRYGWDTVCAQYSSLYCRVLEPKPLSTTTADRRSL